MYLKRSFLFLLLALFLVACGSNDKADAKQNTDTNNNAGTNEKAEVIEVTHLGESDNWRGELQAEFKGGKETTKLKLFFTGDDPKSIESIDYNVEGPESFGKDGTVLNALNYIVDNGKYKESTFTAEDIEIDVTVEWGGETETFQMEKE